MYRLIPSLLLSNRKVVKTVKFKNPSYVGDPLNTIRIFNEKEVDELCLFDINVSPHSVPIDFEYLTELASECFMPLTYGGGISSVEDATRLFQIGFEKISLQSSLFSNLDLLSDLVQLFGSQSIVVSVDIFRSFTGSPRVYQSSKSRRTRINAIDWIQQLLSLGPGELLINSVDRDGTMRGPDLNLLNQLSSFISVPLVYQGGISSLNDIKASFSAGANAVAAGSFFVYNGPHRAVLITYPSRDKLSSIIPSQITYV